MYKHKDGIDLRKLERSDLPDLYCLKEESWWGTHSTLIVNTDDQENWFDSLSSNQLIMVAEWADRDDSLVKMGIFDPVGVALYTDIDWVGRSLRISGSVYESRREVMIVKSAFSAGLDFAFEILNMQRVEAEVMEYHLAAQRLEIDHLGFTVEGRRRKAVYKSGRYYDSLVLGLLREEWQEQTRVKDYGDSCNLTINHSKLARLSARAYDR